MIIDEKIFPKLVTLEKTYDALRFVPVVSLSMEITETREHFRSVPEPRTLEWHPVLPGDMWGDNWCSAWMRGNVRIPVDFEGPAYLRAQTGAPECQLFVDGMHKGVFTVNHPVRLLDLYPTPGRVYQVHLEAYAGHTFPGTMPFDAPHPVHGGEPQDCGKLISKNCRQYAGVDLVSECAEITNFVLDLRTLRQMAFQIDENSLRRARIQMALAEVYALVFAKPSEAPEAVWRPRIRTALDVMKPILALKNGSTTPTFGIIGHSHIDTAWLWTIDETKRKLARTFSSVLSLMDQYPEFRFTQSAAYHSCVVKDLYPVLFERIQQRVAEGRWEINGAMWIEPDCNIPSGESFIRQCLVGQQATREMFGVTSDTLWQPDVFGYSGALPQILKGCGVKYFCTTKLQYNDTNKFPYDSFHWKGIDGTSVVAHFNGIGFSTDPLQMLYAWKDVKHKDVQDRFLVPFGHGDGGGGPTAEMIEIARRIEDLEGVPKTRYMSISEFMDGLAADLTHLPTWSGELYLELHRGTLTSIGAIKRLNRRCEFSLRAAEFAATLATILYGRAYPQAKLLDTWKILLLNQFHDILPGSSIAEVNDQAVAELEHCQLEAEILKNDSLSTIAGKSPGSRSVLIANDLSWDRSGTLSLDGMPQGMRPSGDSEAQLITDVEGRDRLLVDGLTVPSLGFVTVPITEMAETAASAFCINGPTVESPFAVVQFDDYGEIVSFYDKMSRRELVTSGGAFNSFLLGEDVPSESDNWDTDRDQRLKLAPQRMLISRDIAADGPLQLRIRQRYEIGISSILVQDIVFNAKTPRVDFETLVDWHEKHQFLKVAFAVDVLAEEARHEIQYGHLSRTTHENRSIDRAQFDVCAHKWTDISETGFGVAFLNDCKYACTVKNGEYRLSLIKSGRHPDPRGDEGKHRFAYALLSHQGGFSAESVIKPAYEFNVPVATRLSAENDGLPFSLAQIDAQNIVVGAVKWAENGEGFILRMYEAEKTGTHTKVHFGTAIKSVFQSDMLEETPQVIELKDNSIELYFRPFEIKTIRCVPVGLLNVGAD